MNEIIIDGVNLSELKVRYDALALEQAAMRASIVKGSSSFIAGKIKDALAIFETLKDAETKEDANQMAEQIYNLLKDVEFVSNVSGVRYTLPYSSEYGDYSCGECISHNLEDSDNEILSDWEYTDKGSYLAKLYSLAEGMESEVREWNTSYC